MNYRRVASVAGMLFFTGCASAAPVPSRGDTAVSASAAPASAAPAGGLYTVEQATRGERVFGDVCAACHGTNEFRGRMFEITWMAEPVSAFYQHISTAMPQDRPGALKPEEYAAIVAWALRQNGLPAGDREVPADAAALAGYHWK